ncbi:hypothetical protein DUI87_29675 [Hirundo rustica rustica]|uniref:Uncharacterized protein n=1 Tax=Hirundo rustica rustica TaxID=333673 RepID=A0A3M0J5A4_HIRRU|nr:hypothetical protein DUI87_29675 [Hirundo rustica rustica]
MLGSGNAPVLGHPSTDPGMFDPRDAPTLGSPRSEGSSTRMFQYRNVPTPECSDTRTSWNVPPWGCSDTGISKIRGIQYRNVPVPECSSTRMFRHRNVPTPERPAETLTLE